MAFNELKKLQEGQEKLSKLMPEVMDNFKQLHGVVLKDGVLNTREKVLIGLGIATAKQCSYCIVNFVKAAIDLDISLEEIMEACSVSMLMNGGPGVAYTTLVLETYEALKNS